MNSDALLWTIVASKEDNGDAILEKILTIHKDELEDYSSTEWFKCNSNGIDVTAKVYALVCTKETYMSIVEELEKEIEVKSF